MHDADQLYALSARQHGSVATRQAHALGLTYDQVDHLMDSGGWERVTGTVIRRVGSPRSRGQRVMEAVLDAARRRALEADGYRVAAFTDSEIWFDPARTVRRLRALRSGS